MLTCGLSGMVGRFFGASMAVIRRTPSLGSNFWRIWASTGVTVLGDALLFTAAPLLAASLTRDPALVAGLSMASNLPILLFTLHAGAIIDRADRKQIMLLANVVRAGLLTILTIAILSNWANLWFLYAIVFFVATAEVFFGNASQTILPNIVAKEQLETANSRLYSADVVTRRLLGFPLGSFLFSLAHLFPFVIGALGFLVSSSLIASVQGSFRVERKETTRRSLSAEIKEGLGWLWQHRFLRQLALSVGLVNMIEVSTMAVFVLYALEVMHLKEAQYGLLLSAGAIGGLLGSLVAQKLIAGLGRGNTMVLTLLFNGIAKLAMVFFPFPFVVGPALALNSFGGIVFSILAVSTRQSLIPDHLRGRVNSAFRLFIFGMAPIGAVLGGVIAKFTDLPTVYMVAAVLVVGVAVYARFVVADQFETALTKKDDDDFVFEY